LLSKDEARRIAANVVEATEATEKALNSLDADASPQKNRLKGGRNANEENSTGAAFAERMRRYVWCLRLDRTCASTAGLRAPSYAAATARSQSNQSRYCASSALHADHAFNANHNAFNAKHRSKW
jgi:hypothetical protein